MADLVDLRGVSFKYGPNTNQSAGPGESAATPYSQQITGLNEVDFSLGPQESVLICGGSGSGKSSVLRVINGLIPHFYHGIMTGQTQVCGLDPSQAALYELGQQVSTVFQNPRTQFFTTDTTSEMAFAAQNSGVNPRDILARIEQATSMLGCENLLGRSTFRISGGEKQLVACVSAMVAQPRLYLFDEPTSNLSPHFISQFRKMLMALREQKVPMIFAEHRLYYLRDLVDRVILLEDGKIVRQFSADEFWRLSHSERMTLGLRTLRTPAKPPVKFHIPNGYASFADGDEPEFSAENETPSGLCLHNFKVKRANKLVLDIDYLRFWPGKVTAIVGPNGAGKSTLAAAICGLLPSKGQVYLHGKPLQRRQRLQLSQMVMQDVHRQLFGAAVEEEITLGLSRVQVAQTDVASILAEHGLDGLEKRHPMSLSGGQKQRLVVAAARAANKGIHIFDEPSSGLDARHLAQVKASIKSLAKRGDIVVLITHDLELITVADVILELQPVRVAEVL